MVHAHFQANPGAALELLGVGQTRRDPQCDAVELAAYMAVMNVILNMDETVTRE